MRLDDDDFTVFGLPMTFRVDEVELDKRWRALQAQVHPDRYAAEGDQAQRLATQWAVRVNEAYRRLKDPVRRAAYLCERRGVPIQAEDNTSMPAEFLMRQMTWREALDEAQDREALESLDADVRADLEARLAELEMVLDARQDWQAGAQLVRSLLFVQRFRAALDRRLDSFDD